MSRRAIFKFRLYVAADTLNSTQALANLHAICQAHLADRHEIEVVNVFRDPQRALAEGIRMTPTLLKLAPAPVRRIVGTLSQTQRVLETLGLETGAATVVADAKGSDQKKRSSSPTHR
jgi:circadian clock protein KaiB